MRWIDRLLVFVAGVLLLLFGILGVLQWAHLIPRDAHPIFEAFRYWFSLPGKAQNSVFLLVGYGVLLVLGFSLFMVVFQGKDRRRSVPVRTPEGDYQISVRALRELIKATRKKVEGIREVIPSIESRGGGLEIGVTLRVEGGRKMSDVVGEFERKLRRQLADVLGIEDLDDLSIYIEDVSEQTPTTVDFREEESRDNV